MKGAEFDLYDQLNRCFMLAHDQERCFNQMEYFKKYGNNSQVERMQIKLDVYENARKENFLNYINNISLLRDLLKKASAIELKKKSITDKINNIYHQNGKFNDYFDGFKIKFTPYKEEINKLDNDLWHYRAPRELMELHFDYLDFLDFHIHEVILNSCDKIVNTVDKFFDSDGQRKIGNPIVVDPDIYVINKRQVKQLLLFISQKSKEIKKLDKEIDKQRKGAGEKQIMKLDKETKGLIGNARFVSSLESVVNILQERIDAQQRGLGSIKEQIKSDLVDIAYSIYYPKKKRPEDWTFITTEEIEYIKYLVNSVDKNSSMMDEFFDSFVKQAKNSIVFPEFGF